jgi:uncharacterized protein YqeY
MRDYMRKYNAKKKEQIIKEKQQILGEEDITKITQRLEFITQRVKDLINHFDKNTRTKLTEYNENIEELPETATDKDYIYLLIDVIATNILIMRGG